MLKIMNALLQLGSYILSSCLTLFHVIIIDLLISLVSLDLIQRASVYLDGSPTSLCNHINFIISCFAF